MQKRIGLLATGSELTNGEILNTNGQSIAQKLQSLGMEIGEHMITDDTQSNIESAITYLLSRHEALIITGGLGPTSDDLTRFALGNVIGKKLIFNDQSWQRIVERLSKRNIPIPESNRQQALFPEQATIFPNINGTADACYIEHADKQIFMLPGPPRECLPIFQEAVIPILLKKDFGSEKRLHRWRLMGISESAIAEQLEIIGKLFNLQFAYRAAYPYIDIKLFLAKDENYSKIIQAIDQCVAPYYVTSENQPISTILKQALSKLSQPITICDFATKGSIIQRLLTKENHHLLRASEQEVGNYCVVIEGLEEYWQASPDFVSTSLMVTLINQGTTITQNCTIYLRGQETLDYALEFTANCLISKWF